MNKSKSQLTVHLKKKQTPNNVILIVNDGVSNWRSLASSIVASVPSVAFIALRQLRYVYHVRCVAYAACVAFDGNRA